MGICDKCNENPQVTTITLMEKLREWEEKCYTCNLICQSCSSSQTEVNVCHSIAQYYTEGYKQTVIYYKPPMCDSYYVPE
ncbi:hypothetical protein NQ318_020969 [Aromia moschata]|uniref:C4-type zinc-finger of DNA polymerase delta domain-containing protein n=1 Tax=Aromia moschata TaxID=1265417 RepID=A0AAV8YLB0_9CUCU|nr:hypothetical protein NQ318_020969 [Aromia moschata]